MLTQLQTSPTVDPHDPWSSHTARIRSIRQEVPDIVTYELVIDDSQVRDRYRFLPGQFNMLYLPGIGEAAISISSDPSRPQSLLHTVRAVGNVTTALARKPISDAVLVRGPFGSSWPLDTTQGCDIVLAAGGVGLPPLRPAIHHIITHRHDYGRIVLLYGARTPQTLLFTDEYEAWRRSGIEVEVTVDLGDDRWTGHIGVVPTLLGRLTLDAPRTRILTCGPEIMMRFVIIESLSRGVAPENIFLSMERNMNCAIGLCGHCQLGPEFVCKDGPVFAYNRLAPFLNVEEF